jgi:hypothetical protein
MVNFHEISQLIVFLVALKLLPTPANLLTSFASSVHTLVFDSAFCYIKERLTNLPSLKVLISYLFHCFTPKIGLDRGTPTECSKFT